MIAALLSLPTDERYPQLELSPQRRKERTFAALHRRLVSLTRTGPLLLLFEDAHWADPSSLELLDGLLDRLAEMPILLVVSHRPEFTPPWIGHAGATLVTLGRLTREHSATLAELVATEPVLTRALLERIVIQTDGVPLFIEELTKAVLETSPGDTALSLPIPATPQASLMVRLDRLPVGKQVAQIGAVIGREFSHALLVATAGLPEAQLAQGLDELVASGLATRRGVGPEAIYTFKHALVHDAVYESVLKGQQAEIHSAIVAAAERDTLLAIEPSIVGHHCAQAGLVAKAVNYYCLAGKQAAERAAAVETRVQLERGLQSVATLPGSPDHHCLEADLLLALADVLQLTKGFANLETEGVLARAIQLCRRLDDPQLLVRALEAQFAFVATRGDMASAHAAAQELLDGAEASGEPLMNALARMVIGCVLFWQGRFTSARKQLEASVALTARGPEVKWDSRAVHRFGELKRAIPGITQHMLTAQLRELEADGLVSRKIFAEVPPRVEYAITSTAKALKPVMDAIFTWWRKHGSAASKGGGS